MDNKINFSNVNLLSFLYDVFYFLVYACTSCKVRIRINMLFNKNVCNLVYKELGN